jgi:hypothetical protein
MLNRWFVAVIFVILCGIAAIIWEAFQSGSIPSGVSAIPSTNTSSSEASDDDELVFSTTFIDLGLVRDVTKCVFKFENRSCQTVQIRKLISSCSCTAAKMAKTVFIPGEKGEITLEIHPKQNQIGPQYYTMTVAYDGTRHRQIQLQSRLENRPDIYIPKQARFQCLVGSKETDEIALIDYRDEPLKIENVTASSDDLTISLLENPKKWLPGWRYRYSVSYSGNRLPGRYSESITFHTSDPERQEIVLPVSIDQVKRIRFAPATLHLKVGKNGDTVGQIFVDDLGGQELEIASITPSQPVLRYTVKSDGKHNMMIDVFLRKDDVPDASKPLNLRIHVKSPVEEELCVTVMR